MYKTVTTYHLLIELSYLSSQKLKEQNNTTITSRFLKTTTKTTTLYKLLEIQNSGSAEERHVLQSVRKMLVAEREMRRSIALAKGVPTHPRYSQFLWKSPLFLNKESMNVVAERIGNRKEMFVIVPPSQARCFDYVHTLKGSRKHT